jgi:hypothetical protein
MEIKIAGRDIIMSSIKRYRDPSRTITLSYVNYGPGIAYVVTYGNAPQFFNNLADALADLNTSLLNEEMVSLIQALN